jgi:hypothetical protein
LEVGVEYTELFDKAPGVSTSFSIDETTFIVIGDFSSQVLGTSGAAILTASTDGDMIERFR